MSTARKALDAAKRVKDDEFYTRIEDIEKELAFYPGAFEDNRVFIPCDGGGSNFVKYFTDRFDELGLVELTWQGISGEGGRLSRGADNAETWVVEDGRFQSEHSRELLAACDVAVTNPPWSLFREFYDMMVEAGVYYLILCNQNVITYKTVFPRLMDGSVWLGTHMGGMTFKRPDGGSQTLGSVTWLTNLDHTKRHDVLRLRDEWEESQYLRYVNYDAINVDKVVDIPQGYHGVMGVPITFLGKWNPDQFDIVGFRKGDDGNDLTYLKGDQLITPYFRVLIRAKV